MNIRKTAIRIISAILALMPLGGCAKEPHMLDGPGMVNDLTWSDFTLTADGSVYKLESTSIGAEDFLYLRGLRIGEFNAVQENEERNPHVQMQMHYLDGTSEEKEISEELVAEICERFLPYFNSSKE